MFINMSAQKNNSMLYATSSAMFPDSSGTRVRYDNMQSSVN